MSLENTRNEIRLLTARNFLLALTAPHVSREVSLLAFTPVKEQTEKRQLVPSRCPTVVQYQAKKQTVTIKNNRAEEEVICPVFPSNRNLFAVCCSPLWEHHAAVGGGQRWSFLQLL